MSKVMLADIQETTSLHDADMLERTWAQDRGVKLTAVSLMTHIETLEAKLEKAEQRMARLEALPGRFTLVQKYLSNGRIKQASDLVSNTLQALAQDEKNGA